LKRIIGLSVGTVLLIGLAGPASAGPSPVPVFPSQIPFSVAESVPGNTIVVPSVGQDPGMVGVCDQVSNQCAGLRLSVAESGGSASTTQTLVSIAGAICIKDTQYPCSLDGTPFTGVAFSDHTITLPSVHATTPSVDESLCVWILAPQTSPSRCISYQGVPTDVDDGTGGRGRSLGGFIPDRIGIPG